MMSVFFTITNYQGHNGLAFVVGKEVYYTGGVLPPPNKKAVFGHFARQKAYKPRIYGFLGYRLPILSHLSPLLSSKNGYVQAAFSR
jgi:hypothetical protein